MSSRALFGPIKATLHLTAITTMNTAMTNVLLAKMVFQSKGNPTSPTEIIKETSGRTLDLVLSKVEGQLTKTEMSELKGIADSYRQVLKAIE